MTGQITKQMEEEIEIIWFGWTGKFGQVNSNESGARFRY